MDISNETQTCDGVMINYTCCERYDYDFDYWFYHHWIYGYIIPAFCLLGVIFCIITIAILTNKEMR